MSLNHKQRNGLTLIELVVVLSILAAVAGLIVPALTDFTGETHGATGAATITRLDSAMRVEAASRGSVGDVGFDSLVTSAGGDVVPYLMGGNMWASRLTVTDLSSGTSTSLDGTVTIDNTRIAQALVNAGITEVMDMVPSVDLANSQDATFANTDGTIPITFSSGAATGTVAVLTDPGPDPTDLSLKPDGVYVVFGFGDDSQLQGRVVAEASVFMPRNGSSQEAYSNLLVLYEIPAIGNNPIAKYAGTGMPMMNGILGSAHHIQVYHQARDSK